MQNDARRSVDMIRLVEDDLRIFQKGEKYCVVRAIVNHHEIEKKVAAILKAFDTSGEIFHSEYNFVMRFGCYHILKLVLTPYLNINDDNSSAVMAYIIHCNTARNEVIYKMVYGSIVSASESAAGMTETGLRQIRLKTKNYGCLTFWVSMSNLAYI